MPYIGNVLTSFAVETGNINDQAVTAPKLSATGGTNGQVLALDAGGNLVWTSDPAGQWVTSGSNIYFDTGNVGIGTTTPNSLLSVDGVGAFGLGSAGAPSVSFNGDLNTGLYSPGADQVAISTNSSERLRITSDGKVGLGTSSVNYEPLTVQSASADVVAKFAGPTDPATWIQFTDNTTTDQAVMIGCIGNDLRLRAGSQERVRIDSSGRVGVGTTSPGDFDSAANQLVIQNSGNCGITIDATSSTDSNIYFADGPTGSERYRGVITYSHSVDALRFGTNGGTERARIDSSGNVLVGKTTDDITTEGHYFRSNGNFNHTRSSGAIGEINRLGNDGTLINFRQASTIEGSISVSGGTVSYNGAHLSRWSQLPGGVERTEILRGTVLSNIDEMCEWGDEENEQLNRMKLSDVEGDKNVSGVFQAWDDDDDTYTNDFYCAMTGDFVIRISQGITVARGDLLMSAGDGTAKPQDDDIIRSKTIAKVTSTNVSCTYDDGSYCVPCVLMAC